MMAKRASATSASSCSVRKMCSWTQIECSSRHDGNAKENQYWTYFALALRISSCSSCLAWIYTRMSCKGASVKVVDMSVFQRTNLLYCQNQPHGEAPRTMPAVSRRTLLPARESRGLSNSLSAQKTRLRFVVRCRSAWTSWSRPGPRDSELPLGLQALLVPRILLPQDLLESCRPELQGPSMASNTAIRNWRGLRGPAAHQRQAKLPLLEEASCLQSEGRNSVSPCSLKGGETKLS